MINKLKYQNKRNSSDLEKIDILTSFLGIIFNNNFEKLNYFLQSKKELSTTQVKQMEKLVPYFKKNVLTYTNDKFPWKLRLIDKNPINIYFKGNKDLLKEKIILIAPINNLDFKKKEEINAYFEKIKNDNIVFLVDVTNKENKEFFNYLTSLKYRNLSFISISIYNVAIKNKISYNQSILHLSFSIDKNKIENSLDILDIKIAISDKIICFEKNLKNVKKYNEISSNFSIPIIKY